MEVKEQYKAISVERTMEPKFASYIAGNLLSSTVDTILQLHINGPQVSIHFSQYVNFQPTNITNKFRV